MGGWVFSIFSSWREHTLGAARVIMLCSCEGDCRTCPLLFVVLDADCRPLHPPGGGGSLPRQFSWSIIRMRILSWEHLYFLPKTPILRGQLAGPARGDLYKSLCLIPHDKYSDLPWNAWSSTFPWMFHLDIKRVATCRTRGRILTLGIWRWAHCFDGCPRRWMLGSTRRVHAVPLYININININIVKHYSPTLLPVCEPNKLLDLFQSCSKQVLGPTLLQLLFFFVRKWTQHNKTLFWFQQLWRFCLTVWTEQNYGYQFSSKLRPMLHSN